MARVVLGSILLASVTVRDTECTSLLARGDEHKLLNKLTRNYNRSVRPVYNASTTIRVRFGLAVTQIADMDEVNQVLTTNVWIEQEWEDERLKWDPKDYNGLTILRIPCAKIWLPDIVLYNSADDFTTGYMESKAMVNASGNVFWPPPAKLRSSCKIDITYFPFDDQVCKMKFGSWTYDGFQVDLTNRTSQVDLQNYVYSGEWELLGIDIERHEQFYACCAEPYPDVIFTIKIRRKTLYYLFNVVFPCLWLSALSLLGFWLPPDTGEKITLGITVLLAFSVFMLLIAENMPATSEFVPLIGLYLTMTMGMTSLSIILTVVVLQIHHVSPHQKSVPRWLRFVVFRGLARAVCLHRDVAAGNYDEDTSDSMRYPVDDVYSVRLMEQADDRSGNYNGIVRSNVVETREATTHSETLTEWRDKEQESLNEYRHRQLDEYGDNRRGYNARYDDYITRKDASKEENAKPRYELDARDYGGRRGGRSERGRTRTATRTRSHVHWLGARYNAEDEYQRVVNEWRLLAVVIDRVLFYAFLVFIIIATVSILVIFPLNKPKI